MSRGGREAAGQHLLEAWEWSEAVKERDQWTYDYLASCENIYLRI